MTQDPEGMDVSQLVASSSAIVHGVFIGAVSPVKKCEVEEVADVGKVVEDDVDDGCGGAVVVKAEVVAVIGIDS